MRDYLSLFDTERQTQFAAVSFVYKKEFAYVGFRGTDASFTGWRENFNMVYDAPPSRRRSRPCATWKPSR